jgi:hypothetical protein
VGVQSSSAQYYLPYFENAKEYRQNTSGAPQFRSGAVNLYIQDGQIYYLLSACTLDGSNAPFNPNPEAPVFCALGSTGVIVTAGVDGDNDGVADPFFYQVTDVIPATRVEPFRSDKITLYAKPPSTFPLKQNDPLPGLIDNSSFLLYDLRAANPDDILPYDVSIYSWSNFYTSRSVMESEIKPGTTYSFSFPTLNFPERPFYLNFPISFHSEGYKGNGLEGAFRFKNVGPFDGGFAQYDPRLVNFFRWEGFNTSNLMAGDIHFVTVADVTVPGDADSAIGPVIFPPGGSGARIRLTTPTQTEYVLAPGFIGLGREAIFNLEMERRPALGGVKAVSYRSFQLPIKFVNLFAGAMAAAFPDTATAASKAKDADPDGDGIPNWIEWLSATNPTKANAPKTLSSMSFVPPSAVRSGEPTEGYWQMTLDRPIALKDPRSVIVEHSTDLKVWTEIAVGDPNWTVIDEPLVSKVRIISNGPELADKRYFRVRYTFVP